MANCIGREGKTNGKVYNVQNTQAITFHGVAKAAGTVIGKDVEIIHYNPKDFTFPEGKKVCFLWLSLLCNYISTVFNDTVTDLVSIFFSHTGIPHAPTTLFHRHSPSYGRLRLDS